MCHFFDQAAGDPVASESAYRARIVFALDDGQPGNAVIEYGGGCDEKGILESYIDRIRGQKVSQPALADAFAPICLSERDAGDNLIQIVTIESPPQALLFVHDQKMTGGTFIESLYRVSVAGFFTEELGGKRIDEGRERFPFQDGLC